MTDIERLNQKYGIGKSETSIEALNKKYGINNGAVTRGALTVNTKTPQASTPTGSSSVADLLPIPNVEAERRNYAAQMQQAARQNNIASVMPTAQEQRINTVSNILSGKIADIDAQIANAQTQIAGAKGKEKRQLNREIRSLRQQRENYARADAYQAIGNVPAMALNTVKGASEEWAGGHLGKIAELSELINETARDTNVEEIRQQKIDDVSQQIASLQTKLNAMTEDNPEYYGVQMDIHALKTYLVDLKSGQSATHSGERTLADANALMAKSQQDIARAKELNPVQGKLGDFAVDVGSMAVQMGLDRLAASGLGLQLPEAANGQGIEKIGAKLIGMIPFYNRASGGAYVQARSDGGSVGKSAAYGSAVGAIEVATEMLDNIAEPMAKAYGAGIADNAIEGVINKVAKKLAKSDTGRSALVFLGKVIAGGGGEFAEEVIGNVLEWQLPRIYGGDVETAADMISQALYEGATAAVSGAGGTVLNPGSYAEARQTAEEMRTDDANNAAENFSQQAAETGSNTVVPRGNNTGTAGTQSMNGNIILPTASQNGRLPTYAEMQNRGKMEENKASSKEQQFAIIQNSNPMTDDQHTGIRRASEILTYDEATADYDGDNITPDYTAAMVQKAKETGEITVYSSKPIDGGFVTPSKMEAQNYAGDGKVYSATVKTSDVAWIDEIEGQYAKEVNNGREQSIGGEGRTGSLAPAEQSAGVVGIRTEEGNVREGESNGRQNLQSDYVGGVNLGIETAVGAEEDPTKTLREETNYDSDQKAIIEYGSKRGQTVRFYRGDLWVKDKPNGTPYRVRGLIHSDGKTVWVKIDHPDYSAKQIYMHEDFHAAVKSDPKVLERGIRKLKRQYAGDPAGLRALIDRYVERYHIEDTELSDEYILEEILADAHAGIALDTKSRSGTSQALDEKTTAKIKKAADKEIVKRASGNAAEARTKYSINESYKDDISEWVRNGKRNGETFILGATGDVLQGLGAIENDIYMVSDKVNSILSDHPEMTIDEIKRIPEILDDPILVLKSKGKRKGKNSRLVIFGSIKASNGKPVLSVLDLIPTEGKLRIDDMQKVNSAYTKTGNAEDFILTSEVLHADKKRTIPLLRSIGLTITSQELLRSGSIGSINYRGGNVNINGTPMSEVIGTNQFHENSMAKASPAITPAKNAGFQNRPQAASGKNTTRTSRESQEKSSEPKPVSKETEKQFGVESVDGSIVKKSRETWEKTDTEKLQADLVKAGYTEEESKKWIADVNSVSATIATDQERLDYEAADNHTMLKTNQDYYYTLDASTLCAKRLLYQGTFDAVSHRLGNEFLSSDDVIDLRKMMADAGYEVPCGICYVESRRRHLGKYAKQWVDSYKGEYVPTVDEVTTTDGLENLRKTHHQAYKDFMDAMAKKGSANPKVVELRAAYSEEDGLMNLTRKEIENIIRIGGMRIQSFSDFETPHLIDTMQAVLDMSRRNLTSQAYTKVPNFAWVFGNTGIKINLSLIGDVDADGNLVFDNKEGINYDEAMKLRKAYSKNVGTILVGKSDAHIRAAMKSKVIDYIIPFHRSGWGQAEYQSLGLSGYSDYTAIQSEVAVDYGALDGGQFYPIDYWDYSVSGNRNARTYLEKCMESGRLPKFLHLAFSEKTAQNFVEEHSEYGLKVEDLTTAEGMSNLYRKQSNKRNVAQAYFEYALENGKVESGYWKMLIDFKMYDNSGNGAPQETVRADFNMKEANRVLSEYNGGANELPVAQDIVDEFVEKKQSGAKASREEAPEWRQNLDKMVEEYGEMPAGENPQREVSMPNKTSENRKLSMTVRTILEAKATPDSMVDTIEQLAEKGDFSYEVYGDKQAVKDAERRITDIGWDKSLELWKKSVQNGKVSKKNTTLGWALYNNAANSGNADVAIDILNNMVEHQRNAAQALQATRILKKMNPETQLYGVARSVRNLQDELNDRYGDDKSPKLEIDQGLAEHFMKAKTDEERTKSLQDIYVDIGRQMPSRFIDKVNAWRYLAMLGNPRTHIRNILGNAFFAPVVEVKNLTATGIESLVSRVTKIDRTKALVAGKGGKELLSAAWNDYANISEDALGGGKYSDLANANKYIEQGKRVFGNTKSELWNKTGGAVLEGARRGNSNLLEVEDQWFSQPHYAYAMAQYCKANGIAAEQIKSGNGLDKARAYAVKEAQKATYRDTNAFSQFMSNIGRSKVMSKNGITKAFGVAIEGILPFRKTPANILVRGMEYSPLGLIKSLSADLVRVKKGTITASQAIDNISAGLTGTGLLALGIFLASQCLVRGHGGNDDKEKDFADLTGHQDYALELPGGASITLDWMAPEALPFFVGVNLWEQTGAVGEGVTLDTVLNSITNISEPLLEMSCLQSLNDLFESFQYSNSTSGLGKALTSSITSYLTQFVPTIFGQVERSVQENRMTTYTSKTGVINNADVQRLLGGISAKIPGWDYRQIEYIDAWGRTEYSGGFVKRALNNFLNPAYMSEVEVSDMENELMRLYEATGENVFPSRADKTLTVNKQDIILSETQYVEYAKQKGTVSYSVVTSLTNSKAYKVLNDNEKAKAVKLAYDYANQMAKSNVVGYGADSWVTEARNAYEKYQIPISTYILVKESLASVSALKDRNGKSISNSKGLLTMKKLYDEYPTLSKSQREYLFECFDVGQNVIGYTKAEVNNALSEMKRK